MTAATTTQLLKSASRHRLTAAEWLILSVLLYSGHEIWWNELLQGEQPYTGAGLRKGLNGLLQRGWIEILHGHAKYHGKIVLLPILVHADKGQK